MKKRKNNLGDKIYDWRKKNEISQEDFAKLVGVTRQTVLRWESGLAMPKSDKLQLINEITGIGIEQLMLDVNTQPQIEVVADEVVQESEAIEKTKDKKAKMPKKSKIIIVAIVLLLVLVAGILLVLYDKIFLSDFEGSFNTQKSTTWNFDVENLGWGVIGISITICIILSVILIYKSIKNKKSKIDNETQENE